MVLNDRRQFLVDLSTLDSNTFYSTLESIEPDRLCLILPDNEKADIGVIAYTRRKRLKPNSIQVDQQSLDIHRLKPIQRWVTRAGECVILGELRLSTVGAKWSRLQTMINWADENLLSDLFQAPENYLAAITHFVDFISDRCLRGEIGTNYASLLRNEAIASGAWFFDAPEFNYSRGPKNIRHNHLNTKQTRTPETKEVEAALSLCGALFNELSDFTMDNSSYPYLLRLPTEHAWLIPCIRWVATEECLRTRHEWLHGNYVWDYSKGKILEPERYAEMPSFVSRKNNFLSEAVKECRRAQKFMDDANSSATHPRRMQIARYALDAFLILFAANTGINEAQLRDIPCPENFRAALEVEIQGFRTIKYRADGRLQEYRITTNFIPAMERYLKLREYVLAGRECPYLFFSFRIKNNDRLRKLTQNATFNFYNVLIKDFNLPTKITYRGWRKYKGFYFLVNSTPEMAALALQNSLRTIDQSYSEGIERDAEIEFNAFWLKLKETLEEYDVEKSSRIPAGNCKEHGNPEYENLIISTKPTCAEQEGCLFCNKYFIHADENDLRKILSMAFVIEQLRPSSSTSTEFEHYYRPTLDRIDLICEKISARSEKHRTLLSTVKHDVFTNQRLTQYWTYKLDFLINIGAV